MRIINRLIFLFYFIHTIVNSEEVMKENNTETKNIQDSNLDGTIKSALDNGLLSDVVVKKDVLLFPVNEPNLVITHSQEIHGTPIINDTNEIGGKQTVENAIRETNEFTLSHLNSTLDSNNFKNNASDVILNSTAILTDDSQNNLLLKPNKPVDIVSDFNLMDGLTFEKASLPKEIHNSSRHNHLIDSLSKIFQQPNTSVTTIPL